MRLETPTLFIMTVAVTFTAGVLFLMTWSQSRRETAPLIWGIAHLLGSAASCALGLRGAIPDSVSIGLANAVMIVAYGLIWSGVRAFERRSPLVLGGVGGGLVWCIACLVPAFYASLTARVILASSIAGLFCLLGARTIWRGRGEALASRVPATILLSAYGGFYVLRVPLVILAPPPSSPALPTESLWFSILCFVGTLFSVAIAFVFMALTKERAEREQRLAAETDSLTGIANRRAFVARAGAALVGGPAALLVFDLDHFKSINDGYGHSVGDAVLAAFCHAAAPMLPEDAMLGRMGGEEFACLLPGIDARAGARIAERVRDAVSRVAHTDYPDLLIRTSVGVAETRQRGGDLEELIRRADRALYRAKRMGRDRVTIDLDQAHGFAA